MGVDSGSGEWRELSLFLGGIGSFKVIFLLFVFCILLDMSKYHRPDAKVIQSLKDIANKLRIHSINSTNASNSG